MKKIKYLIYLTILLLIVTSALLCQFSIWSVFAEKSEFVSETSLQHNTTNAIKYIESYGYENVSYIESIQGYALKKELLVVMPYKMYWSVQSSNPEDYYEKIIFVEKFSAENKSSNKVNVYLLFCEDEIVGGYIVEDKAIGWVYSIDGKTLEEITGLDFQTWQELWDKKYAE